MPTGLSAGQALVDITGAGATGAGSESMGLLKSAPPPGVPVEPAAQLAPFHLDPAGQAQKPLLFSVMPNLHSAGCVVAIGAGVSFEMLGVAPPVPCPTHCWPFHLVFAGQAQMPPVIVMPLLHCAEGAGFSTAICAQDLAAAC